MKVYIIGLPGCGKTFLSEKLAARLSVSFFDLDCLIIKYTGKDINSIFKEDGETYFRKIEAQLLRETTLNNDDFILSTGGGAPCFHQNISFINEHGLSIYLNVPVSVIAGRLLKKGIDDRPLLKEKKEVLERELYLKLNERRKFYEQAKIQVKGENISVEMVLEKISNYKNLL